MEGLCRIKVWLENAPSFWMLIDTEQFLFIADVKRHIESKLNKSKLTVVSRLLLEGVELPIDESSRILRDNDAVHVIIQQTSTIQHQKSTCDDAIGIEVPFTECDGQIFHVKDPPAKEKKKHKDKLDRKSVKKKHRLSESCNSAIIEEAGQQEIDAPPKKIKKKRKSIQEYSDNEANSSRMSLTVGNDSNTTISKVSTVFEPLLKQLKSRAGTGTILNTTIQHQSETCSVRDADGEPKSTAADEPMDQSPDNALGVNIDHVKPGKKRRRHRKSNKSRTNTSAAISAKSEMPLTAFSRSADKLRLPKAKQPNGKKTLFDSDEEDTEAAASSEINEMSQIQVCAEKNGSVETGSSFSEAYPVESVNSLNTVGSGKTSRDNKSFKTVHVFNKFLKTPNKTDAVDSESSLNSSLLVEDTEQNTENVLPEENVAAEKAWRNRSQNYDDQHAEGKQDKKMTSSQRTSLNQYNFGHLERTLVDHLKLAPHERGAELPPYMTATRLPSGAFVYKRTPLTAPLIAGDASDRLPVKSGKKLANAARSVLTRSSNDAMNNDSTVFQSHDSDSSSPSGTNNNKGSQPSSGTDNGVAGDVSDVKRDYSKFQDLTSAPLIGDKIAYKILEMGEDYTPGISGYKEALVLDHDKTSGTLTVRVLHETGKKKPGRFDLPEDESTSNSTLPGEKTDQHQ